MKKKNLMWGALVAIAFASCTQDEVLNNGFGTKTLSVTLEDANYEGSRVGFADQTAAFHWTKGDKIGVTTTKSSTTFQGMTLEGNGGEATGTFSGTFNGTALGYAVYPYGASGRHSVTSGGVLTYTLPAEYTYSTLDTEYAKADGNSHNAPMWGSIANGAVSFKHLGGVIAFSVGNLPANTANMKFVLTAINQISGSFAATLTGSEPMITSTSTNVDEADKKVTINFSTAEGQTSGYFYVPVPTGPLGNLSLVILNGQEEVATGAWDNITIARKDIKRATIGSQSIIGGNGEIKQVSSVSNVDAALSTTEDNLTVQVSDEVTGTGNTITIPVTLETNTTTFSFSSVADDAKITIQNAAGGAYDGQIIIEIPEGETLPEVVATIPDGEVYIKQGTVTTLVVSSASNTTIIGANAKIGTLTVEKGNVRIEDGGEVADIKRATDNTATVYVVYESAEAPSITVGEGVVLMSAVEWDLMNAAKNGGEYTLTSDMQLTLPVIVEKDLTVNLNGHNLTGGVFAENNGTITAGTSDSYVFWVKGGKLIINGNGSVKSQDATYSMAVWANGGKVEINGGSYSNGGDGCDLIYASGTSTVMINGGEFKATKRTGEADGTQNEYSALNIKDANRSTCIISVTGGKFYQFDPANNVSEGANTNFVAAGYSSVLEGDNYVVSQGVKTEIALLAAVKAGGKVTLNGNITLTAPIIIEKDVTINLNNYNLTGGVFAESNGTITAGTSDSYVFWVKGGKLIINGNGSVKSQDATYSMAVWANGGEVEINGGSYSNGGDGCDLIYASGTSTVTINGGEFKATKRTGEADGTQNEYSALNIKDSNRSTCMISVTGGKFYRFDPANNVSEGANTNFVAAGYSSVPDNEYYVVSQEVTEQ